MPVLAALLNLVLPGLGHALCTRKRMFGLFIALSVLVGLYVEVAPHLRAASPLSVAALFVFAVTFAVDGYTEASASRMHTAEGGGLTHPQGSKVSTEELLREVDEYFSAGASVSPGDIVIDVGANVGAFSLRAAEKCGSDVTLYCFEPSPETFRALNTNMEQNPLLQKTRHVIQQRGLSSKEHSGSELSFYNFRNFPTNSTFDLAAKRREFEIFFEDRARRFEDRFPIVGKPVAWFIAAMPKGTVGWWMSRRIMGFEETKARIETLDDVLMRENIERVDLLKIDVEGPELDVLRGLGTKTWPRIKQVVMETHNRDGRQPKIEALLKSNGLSKIRTTLQKTIDNGLESIVIVANRP